MYIFFWAKDSILLFLEKNYTMKTDIIRYDIMTKLYTIETLY